MFTKIYGKEFNYESALDYGSGVGRLTIPFAKHTSKTIGVDISLSMRNLAKSYSKSEQLNNCQYISPSEFMNRNDKFDLVHSFIVIQHIHPKIGIPIFKKLVDSVSDAKFGAIHITYDSGDRQKSSSLIETCIALFKYLKYFTYCKFHNIEIKKNPFKDMDMYTYPHNDLMSYLSKYTDSLHIKFTKHGSYGGCFFFFQKKKNTEIDFPDESLTN